MTTPNEKRKALLGELDVKMHQVRRQLSHAHYEWGAANTHAVFLEWGAKLRTAISLAESRLDVDIFAHSMRVATLVGDNLPGHRDRFNVEDDNTAGLKAMVVGVLHDLIEDQVEGIGEEPEVSMFELADKFGTEVANAVQVLIRTYLIDRFGLRSRMLYCDYIAEVAKNDLATLVKIADLEDHLSKANASTLKRTLRPRYERAWSQLMEIGTQRAISRHNEGR